MEEKKQEKKTEYKTVKCKNSKRENKFVNTVITPLFFSIIGIIIVLYCLKTNPVLRKYLINEDKTQNQQISITDYSITASTVAEKVLPSIVGIKIEYKITSPLYGTGTATAQGSGIIISEDGYILTNNHVVSAASSSEFYNIEQAEKVIVKIYGDEQEHEATIVGQDEQTDLAVIKVEKTGLKAAKIGDSETLKIGEFAMAIGNPLGMESSVTAGIISGLNRTVKTKSGTEYKLIQTDAAINSGNSGGALVNTNGEVIGINTLKMAGNGISGMGFAIPINATLDVTNELIQYKKVRRPYLGIGGIEVSEKIAEQNNLQVGIYVKTLKDFSSAEKAGIKVGDVITKIDDTPITTMSELNEFKNKKKIGDKITLTVYRQNQEMKIEVELEEAPEE